MADRGALSKKKHDCSTAKDDVVTKIKETFQLFDAVKQLIPENKLRPSGGNGRWWIGHCPFHADLHPSFWIDTERGLWCCLAVGCIGDRGGDVINLLALAHHNTVTDEIKALAGGLPRG
jgi:DNA primase